MPASSRCSTSSDTWTPVSEAPPRWRRIATAGAVLAVVGLGVWMASGGIAVGDALLALVDKVRGAGPLGVVMFGVGFLLWAVVCLPASWPQMAAGFLYGPLMGFVVAWVLSMLSTWINAVLGRTLFVDRVQAALHRRGPTAVRLQERLAEQGTSLVVLMRMPPVSPFHPLSYALGSTKLPMGSILLGTAVGGLVPVTVYSWLGASVTELARLLEGEGSSGSFWVSGGITLVATVLITVRVRREVRLLDAGG